MWFFSLLALAAVIWLLWVISRNTSDTLDKQAQIHAELIKLNKQFDSEKRSDTAQSLPKTIHTAPIKTPVLESSSKPIHINQASLAELTTLPGVGKSIAQKIISARPVKNIEGLADIPGINQDLIDKIKMKIEF